MARTKISKYMDKSNLDINITLKSQKIKIKKANTKCDAIFSFLILVNQIQ